MPEDIFHRLLDLIWLIPIGLASYGLKFLRDLTRSVQHLNENIAMILYRVSEHEKTLDDHESRLRGVEH